MSKIGNAMLTIEERFQKAKKRFEFNIDRGADALSESKPTAYFERTACIYLGMMYAYAEIQDELLGDNKLIKILFDNMDEPEL